MCVILLFVLGKKAKQKAFVEQRMTRPSMAHRSGGEAELECRRPTASSCFMGLCQTVAMSDCCWHSRTAMSQACKPLRTCRISKGARHLRMPEPEAEPEQGLAWTVCAKAGNRWAGQNGAGQVSIGSTGCCCAKLTLKGCTAGMYVMSSPSSEPH